MNTAVLPGRGNESGTEEVQTSGRPAGEANAGEKPVQNGKKSPAFRRGEPLGGSRNGEGRPANLSLRELTSQLLRPTGDVPAGKAAAGANGKQTERQREEAESTEGETQSSREPGAESESEHETEEGKAAEGPSRSGQAGTPKPGGEADAPEGEEAAEAEEGTEGAEGDDVEVVPTKAELPEEVKEAIEIAKAQDGGKGKAQLLKRVHKLVDERDTHRNMRLAAEEQNHQLRSELQEARNGTGSQREAGHQGQHPEVQQVAQEIHQVDAWLNWLEENPQGGSVTDAQGKAFDVPAEKVARMTRELGNARSELVARKASTETAVRQATEAAYQQFHARAVEVHPWLKESKSPEYQRMSAILNALPQLKGFPDHELLIGFMFAGEKAAAEAAKVKAARSASGATRKVPATREPPRVVTDAPARGSSRTPGKGKTEESVRLEEEFQKTGSVRALGQMFAAKARGARTNKS